MLAGRPPPGWATASCPGGGRGPRRSRRRPGRRGCAAAAAGAGRPADLVGVVGSPSAASRPWRSRTRSRGGVAAGRSGDSPVSRPCPTAITVPSRSRRSRKWAALRATASRWDCGSARRGATMTSARRNSSRSEPEVEVSQVAPPGGWRRRRPRARSSSAAPSAGEPELDGDLRLGAVVPYSGGRSARGARSLRS